MSVEIKNFAQELQEALESGKFTHRWWTVNETKNIDKWIAMREMNKEKLKSYAGWDPKRRGRPYKLDSLPEKISVAWADFLYGEDPTITAHTDGDQDRLDTILEENDFVAGIHHAVDVCSSEGEVWWRIYVDPEQQSTPILEWVSRANIIPLWRGKRLLAAALINEVERSDEGCWRHVEIHEEGSVSNLLYREKYASQSDNTDSVAVKSGIGEQVALTAHHSTAELEEVWEHGLDLLIGRVPNRLGRNPGVGISDYAKIEDQIFDLYEAHTIDAENFRLAGKKRAVMPKRFADERGDADSSEEILWTEDDWDEMSTDSDKSLFKLLEYTYDGQSSINRKEDLVGTCLTRVGLARQFVDANAKEGWGVSGVNLKVRLLPTALAARGKSRYWDAGAPAIVMRLQLVDALDEQSGGFGTQWASASEVPSVERASVMPEDPTEEFARHGGAISSGLESIEIAIGEIHPDWTEEQQQEEVARIKKNLGLADDGPPSPDKTSDEEEPPPEEEEEE